MTRECLCAVLESCPWSPAQETPHIYRITQLPWKHKLQLPARRCTSYTHICWLSVLLSVCSPVCLCLSLSPGSVSQSQSSVRVEIAEMFSLFPLTNHRPLHLIPGNYHNQSQGFGHVDTGYNFYPACIMLMQCHIK